MGEKREPQCILLLLQSFTFGYKRAEILGALLSIVTIWYVTGVLVYLVSPNSGPVQVLTISENAGGRSTRVVQGTAIEREKKSPRCAPLARETFSKTISEITRCRRMLDK